MLLCTVNRCSAKDISSIDHIFKIAEKAVLYPLRPIYTSKRFTAPCLKAFRWIFRRFDTNCDGLLSDEELNELQHFCFGSYLHTEEIQEIKKLIRASSHDKEEQKRLFVGNKLTVLGFLGMVRVILVDRELLENVWDILRACDLDDDLHLQVRPSSTSDIYHACILQCPILYHAVLLTVMHYVSPSTGSLLNFL